MPKAKTKQDKPLESINEYVERVRANPQWFGSPLFSEWLIYIKLRLAAALYDDISNKRHTQAMKFYAKRDHQGLRKLNNKLISKYGDHVWTHSGVSFAIEKIHAHKESK